MNNKLTLAALIALLSLSTLTACDQEGPIERGAENVDESIEDAAENTGDAIDEAEDETEDAVDDATD